MSSNFNSFDHNSFCSGIPSMTQEDKYNHEHQLAKNYIDSLPPMERLGLPSDPRTAMACHIMNPILNQKSQWLLDQEKKNSHF